MGDHPAADDDDRVLDLFRLFRWHPSDGVPYPIFVYVALLPWIFFSNSVALASTSLITSAQVVSKIYFPRLIVPVATILAGLVDFAVASGVLVLMMIYYGIALSANLLVVPVLLLGVLMAAIGLGTLLCALVVVYRDIKHVVPFLLQLGMFVTPVAYPREHRARSLAMGLPPQSHGWPDRRLPSGLPGSAAQCLGDCRVPSWR